jgi:hypothetical protein
MGFDFFTKDKKNKQKDQKKRKKIKTQKILSLKNEFFFPLLKPPIKKE